MNKRKSILALTLVLVLCIGLLSGCGSTKTTTARLVKTTYTTYNADGSVESATSVTYDYETSQYTKGTQSGTSKSWEYMDGTFTYNDIGILSEYCENTETGSWESTESTLWDNGSPKTTQSSSSNGFNTSLRFNEYGWVQNTQISFDDGNGDSWSSNYTYTYTVLDYDEISGESVPTYVFRTVTYGSSDNTESASTYITLSYDTKGNLTKDEVSDESGQTTGYAQYTYNSKGNRIRSESYALDDNGELYLSSVTENTYE